MLFVFLGLVLSLDNGLALTPPMGWMAWEQFRCETDCSKYPNDCINENLFVDMIDRIAEDGWLELGYEYVSIDDCWMGKGRDVNGELYPDQSRFPHNITWLAEYAHKKGVKLGIYNDFGTLTCGGYTGSEGYLRVDALTFGKWKVDMLKMDGCYSELINQRDGYPAMTHFLNKTGRPILYSCSWPAYDDKMDYSPLPEHCNLWRNYGDITSSWPTVKTIIDKWGNTPEWAKYAGPGHWNDPDQLMIGLKGGKITKIEGETQMAIWAIVAAPLIMSNDLRQLEDWAKEILQNKEVIEVDQDPLGIQGFRLTENIDKQVWYRQLSNNEWAVALFNHGESTTDITVTFKDFAPKDTYTLRDLFKHEDIGTISNSYTGKDIPAHGVVFLRLKP
ncbi:hypothetical protein TRFO_38776 [Tritrichomonas foetus]|uniref:Alpha-galactosidase n=1 Tax=Tritrichomonas foetus TaxID=1144522 RepID=A0A1J4JBL2_9EUKA|nr:hypothetical protein TRFO_38776 [Tritrichomonas foetus]|eukprot:OHS95043.1 hypothetical protein TRFO_38776 [Tritrichomonas foetus]